jgi:hypothetical protein
MAEEFFHGAAKIGGVISNSCGGAGRASNVSRLPSTASQPFEWSSRLQLTSFPFFIPFGDFQRVDVFPFSPEEFSARGERITTNKYKLNTFFNLKGEIL